MYIAFQRGTSPAIFGGNYWFLLDIIVKHGSIFFCVIVYCTANSPRILHETLASNHKFKFTKHAHPYIGCFVAVGWFYSILQYTTTLAS